MEKIEITKEMDFALEWVSNNAKNYAFIPDMLLDFTKDYNEALKQSDDIVLDSVSVSLISDLKKKLELSKNRMEDNKHSDVYRAKARGEFFLIKSVLDGLNNGYYNER